MQFQVRWLLGFLALVWVAGLALAQPSPCIRPDPFPSKFYLGEPVRVQLTVSVFNDNVSEIRWRLQAESGRLPEGLELSESGLLTGAPKVDGPFEFVLRVSAAGCETVDLAARGTVLRRLTITGNSVLPEARAGDRYAYQFGATGAGGIASPLLAWAARGLPRAFSMDAVTGRVTGTPATAGVFRITVRVEQRVRDGEGTRLLGEGERTVTLIVGPAPGAPFTLSPLQLRFNFSPSGALPNPQLLVASAPPSGSVVNAAACAIYDRLGPLGYPVVQVRPVEGGVAPGAGATFAVSVEFSQSSPEADPCRTIDVQSRITRGAVAETPPLNEVIAEVRVFAEPARDTGPVIKGTVQDPEFRALVVLNYSEGSLLVVPRRVTMRLSKEGGPLPSKLIPIVSRQWGTERNFTIFPRTITPANRPWFSVVNLGVTPAAIEVKATESARALAPGVYLAILDVEVLNSPPVRQSLGKVRLAGEGEPQRIPVVLIVGPDIPFQFSPDQQDLDNPRPEVKIETQAPKKESELAMQTNVAILEGPPNLLSTDPTFKLKDGLKLGLKTPRENGSYRALLAAQRPPDYFAVLEVDINVSDGSPKVTISTDAETPASSNANAPVESEANVTATDGANEGEPIPRRAAAAVGADPTADSGRLIEVSGVKFRPSAFSQGDWLSVDNSEKVTPYRLKLTIDPRKAAAAKNQAGLLVVQSEGTRNPVEARPIALRIFPPADPPPAPAANVGVRFSNGNGWSSRLVLINPSAQPVSTTVRFRPTGASASIAFRGFVFTELVERGFLSEVNRTLAPYSSFTLTSQGVAVIDGWVEVQGSPLAGYVLLRRVQDSTPFETTIPLGTGSPTGTLLPFDNTSGTNTFFALTNPTPSQGRFVLTARDASGQPLGRTDPQPVLPFTGRLVNLADLLRSTGTAVGVAGQSGSVEFTSLGIDTSDVPNGTGQVVSGPPLPIALFRQTESGAISTAPALPVGNLDGALTRRAIPLVAFGGGWDTRISLLNADFVGQPAILRFTGADGSALRLQAGGTTASSFPAQLGPQGAYQFRANPAPAAAAQGSASLLAYPGVGAQAIVEFNGGGRRAETAIQLEAGGRQKLLIPFDNTEGFETQLILVNSEIAAAVAQAAVYDASGARLDQPAGSRIDLSRRLHFSLTTRFPETTGRAGFVALIFTEGEATAVALRTKDGTLSTSLPIF